MPFLHREPEPDPESEPDPEPEPDPDPEPKPEPRAERKETCSAVSNTALFLKTLSKTFRYLFLC